MESTIRLAESISVLATSSIQGRLNKSNVAKAVQGILCDSPERVMKAAGLASVRNSA